MVQEEFYTNMPAEAVSAADEYENIEVVVKTADVMRQFDDVITESDVVERQPSAVQRIKRTSQDDTGADMLSLAEHARQKLIQRRSRENPTSDAQDHNTTTVVRPVAQQRSQFSSDPQSEQFKQLLAAKAANRRVPGTDDPSAVNDLQAGLSRPTPVPASRPGVSKTMSVDAALTWRQQQTLPASSSAKQKTRSVVSDDISRLQQTPVDTTRYCRCSLTNVRSRPIQIGYRNSEARLKIICGGQSFIRYEEIC